MTPTRTAPSPTVVALVGPAILLAVGLPVLAALSSGATGEVAVHWGPDGAADGFAPAWTVPVFTALVGGGLPLLLGVMLLASPPRGGLPSPTHKLLASVAVGVAALAVGLGIWMLASQQGGSAPPQVGLGLLIGFGAAALLGAAGWIAMPRAVVAAPRAREPLALDLADGERAAWVGTTRLSRGVVGAIVAGVLAALGITVTATIVSDGAAWPMLLLPVVLGALLVATSSFTVRIDEAGLVARGALGAPSWRIPAADVQRAAAVDVSPFGDFGGWGVRYAAGRRSGIVVRAGEALEVTRRDGRSLVVTIDDADAAAALLTAVAARA